MRLQVPCFVEVPRPKFRCNYKNTPALAHSAGVFFLKRKFSSFARVEFRLHKQEDQKRTHRKKLIRAKKWEQE